jgi:phospholipid/cholesterol/gamma-HCH transport system substrate-binding protein
MSGPGSDERHLELKVGAMILVALALLVTFILILSDFNPFQKNRRLEVYFENPGGLMAGAAVKVAGRKAGTIAEMSFLGQEGPLHPATQRPSFVRARLDLEEGVYDSLRSDARFYVTTKGLLGDPFMEVDPGGSQTKLDTSKPVFGINPPRLDLFLADAYELVRGLNSLLRRNNDHLDTLLGGGARLVDAVDEWTEGDAGVEVARIDRIIEGVEGLVEETRGLVTGAREKYVDDPGVQRMLRNMEQLSTKLNREIDPLLADVRGALEAVDRLSGTIGPEEQKHIKSAIAKLDGLASRADKMIGDVDAMIARLKRGDGTVGQLLQDEEIYDDLKELVRDIKRHPWKLIWED